MEHGVSNRSIGPVKSFSPVKDSTTNRMATSCEECTRVVYYQTALREYNLHK